MEMELVQVGLEGLEDHAKKFGPCHKGGNL